MDAGDCKEGGWGWVVTMAAGVAHAVAGGVAGSVGVLLVIFRDYYNLSYCSAAWGPALLLAAPLLAGLPGTVLTWRLGFRGAASVGGVVAAAGLGLSTLTTHYWGTLPLFYGLTGFGFGLVLTPSLLVIEDYFYERRGTAVCVAVSGSGLGAAFTPLAIHHLETLYAWKGMALLLAAACLNILICAAIYRPANTLSGCSRRSLQRIFEPVLLKNSAFQALLWSGLLWSVGVGLILSLLPSCAIQSGASRETAAVLVGVAGLASLLTRPMFQTFSQSARLDHMSAVLCSVGFAAVLCGLFPQLWERQAGQVGYCIILGLHTAFWDTFVEHLASEVVGEDYVAFGRGYRALWLGVGLLAGPPLGGWILDHSTDCNIAFYFAGACLLLSNLILVIANGKRCYFLPSHELCEASDTESSSSNRILQLGLLTQRDGSPPRQPSPAGPLPERSSLLQIHEHPPDDPEVDLSSCSLGPPPSTSHESVSGSGISISDPGFSLTVNPAHMDSGSLMVQVEGESKDLREVPLEGRAEKCYDPPIRVSGSWDHAPESNV